MAVSNNTANNSENKEKHQEIEACQCNDIHLPYTYRAIIHGLNGFFLVEKLSEEDNKRKKGKKSNK
jgi:hypothetical protein